MCAAAHEKLGLVVPADLHDRMIASARDRPRGALQAEYAAALTDLLDCLDDGAPLIFAAVRGPKRRVTVRLSEALTLRLRTRLEVLNLKITDFACAAIARRTSKP